jgi:hypothetical protein
LNSLNSLNSFISGLMRKVMNVACWTVACCLHKQDFVGRLSNVFQHSTWTFVNIGYYRSTRSVIMRDRYFSFVAQPCCTNPRSEADSALLRAFELEHNLK